MPESTPCQSLEFHFEDRPWTKFYGDVPVTLQYPQGTMYEVVRQSAQRIPDQTAYEFMGIRGSYRQLLADIDRCAAALEKIGVGKGDCVAIALPNIPQVMAAIYAVNKLGGICVMIHPLSSADEMRLFFSETRPKAFFTLNLLYEKFRAPVMENGIGLSVLCRINDSLGPIEKAAVNFIYRGKGKVASEPGKIIYWTAFLAPETAPALDAPYAAPTGKNDCAAILYSGGTSGNPKGMALSNLNFNALARQLSAQYEYTIPFGSNFAMVTVLPMFHGFGLGCCTHAMMLMGLRSILIPQFSAKAVAKIINKKHPNLIAGPPTLYEALMRSDKMKKADMSSFIGIFSGGDKLPADTKRRFDDFLAHHGCKVHLREGYGLTETVTACMLTPETGFLPGCVGIPFPDMLVQICKPGTTDPVPVGEDGEICVVGPTVMLGYINNDADTKEVMVPHADGRVWLHTGDMGYVDEDGFVFFRQRIKRIFKISGYTIYPSMIEETVNTHPKVSMCCAIAVEDQIKMSRVKLFVQLEDGVARSDALKVELRQFCKEHLNVWSVPKEIEFCDVLPTTKVGKVDFRALEQLQQQRAQAAAQ